MHLQIEDLPDVPPDLVAEVKAFVRIDHELDDEAIIGFLRSAAILCEDFIGQLLFEREIAEQLPVVRQWQRLKQLPVKAISSVEALAADGAAAPIGSTDHAIDIDHDSIGWVRLHGDVVGARILVTYLVGLAPQWDAIPATLRQGIVRLAGYLYANRDGVEAGGPPSAVTALWRPHRRMRLA